MIWLKPAPSGNGAISSPFHAQRQGCVSATHRRFGVLWLHQPDRSFLCGRCSKCGQPGLGFCDHLLPARHRWLGFDLRREAHGSLVSSGACHFEQPFRLWRAPQPVQFHHCLGYEPLCRGGSLHQPGAAEVGAGANEYARERHLCFQRF